MKFVSITSLLVLIIIATAATAFSQPKMNPATFQEEVKRMERAWLDAYEKHDVAAMTEIVADDFTITFPNGSMQNKTKIIDSLKRGGSSAMKFRTENVQSRAYGDTVILIGLVISEWTQDGKPMSDRSRYTDTYVRRNGKWQVVASHLSAAPK